MGLDDVRRAIDTVDGEIVALIGRRQRLVRQASKFKHDDDEVRAPDRVEQVIRSVRERAAASGTDPDVVEAAYRAMIDSFIEYELRIRRHASQ
ncbi:chorismate mutase [Solwaraspora sp. WMMB335]|uniref:chorismate mutase n=1 Tax=Solwaraspora sp. WMMB335 TaxID=3404118 RepID=UPI003B953316